MPVKLLTASGGAVTLQGANTAVDTTVTVPAISGGTLVSADSSGNVGIGTSTPGFPFQLRTNPASAANIMAQINPNTSTNAASLNFNNGGSGSVYVGRASSAGTGPGGATISAYDTFFWNSGAQNIVFGTNDAERIRLDTSGNVGIGTSSPGQKLDVKGFTRSSAGAGTGAGGAGYALYQFGTSVTATENWHIGSEGDGSFRFYNQGIGSGIERARIDSSGNLLVGTANSYGKLGCESSANSRNIFGFSTIASGFTDAIFVSEFRTYSPNNATARFMYCGDTVGARCEIRSNGGLANFSANNVNLSDARLKTDVQPATSYLQKICAIPVVTYLYKDQTDTELNLGVLAQDVEAVAPELVDNSGFGEAPEGEAPYKAIYQTDLQYALMKCIQEQQAMIEELKAKVAALEAKA